VAELLHPRVALGLHLGVQQRPAAAAAAAAADDQGRCPSIGHPCPDSTNAAAGCVAATGLDAAAVAAEAAVAAVAG